MSSKSATRRASAASDALQHPCLCEDLRGATAVSELTPSVEIIGSEVAPLAVAQTVSSVAPDRMKRPMTSYPWRFSSTAAAELSTPPLIANTTRRVIVANCLCRPTGFGTLAHSDGRRSKKRLQIAHRARLIGGRVPIVPNPPIPGEFAAVRFH